MHDAMPCHATMIGDSDKFNEQHSDSLAVLPFASTV